MSDIHVFPVGGNHDTESRDCWCQPRVARLCIECDGDNPDCWACGGEGVVDTGDPTDDTIVVHNDIVRNHDPETDVPD